MRINHDNTTLLRGKQWTACCDDVAVIVYNDIILFASADCMTFIDDYPVIERENGDVFVKTWRKIYLPVITKEEASLLIERILEGYLFDWGAKRIGVFIDGQWLCGKDAEPYFFELL